MNEQDFESQHQAALKHLTAALPAPHELEAMVNVFKAFGDTTRARILLALGVTPLSVTEISDALGMSQSSISHQLSLLRQLNLVVSTRHGRSMHYQLADQHIMTIFQQTKQHIVEDDNDVD